jgi:hypothetical protein
MGQLYDSAAIYDWSGTYDGGVDMPVGPPGFGTVTRAPWNAGALTQSVQRSLYGAADAIETVIRLTGEAAAPLHYGVRLPWGKAIAHESDVRIVYGPGSARERVVRSKWRKAIPHDAVTRIRWLKAQRLLQSAVTLEWGIADPRNDITAIVWGVGEPHELMQTAPWGKATPREIIVRIVWKAGAQHAGSYTTPWNNDPPLPPGSTIVIPPREVYYMTPSLTIIRTSDSADLNAIDCQLTYDITSYAWTFQANIPRASLALVDPKTRDTPELVQISVNGYLFNCIVEAYSDNRRFGASSVQITGRSRSALLGPPYAPRATFTETAGKDASQLATDALADTGWTLVWNAPDWLVPGSTFTYADKTPIEAVAQIVNSIGAVLYCDPAELTLTVNPMYPTSPWSWSGATPFASIPNAFWTNIDGQWEGQGAPDYNGVYVSGQNGGVVGLVKLTGTDGAKQLPAVNDALITDIDAGRERGRIEIAKGTKQKTETVSMPVLPAPASDVNPGIIPPGSLLEIDEQDGSTWRGQAMGVQINAQRSSGFSVRQVMPVERHA